MNAHFRSREVEGGRGKAGGEYYTYKIIIERGKGAIYLYGLGGKERERLVCMGGSI